MNFQSYVKKIKFFSNIYIMNFKNQLELFEDTKVQIEVLKIALL